MNAVTDAVVLMAGAGSRLRVGEHKVVKPLVPLLGRSLVSYTLDALARCGIKRIFAVVGFEKEILTPQLQKLCPPGIELRFVENPEWKKQNGISVLAAASHVSGSFVLTMADHLFEPAIVDLLLRQHINDDLFLAVDRKIDKIFDIADAMKVKTRGDRIIAIAKDLTEYDAIDTGVFLCPPVLFRHLESAKQNDDCSLADGVRAMAAVGHARAIDIGAGWWQDVDTPEMLAAGENQLRSRLGLTVSDRTKDEAGERNRGPQVKDPIRAIE
ncbi:MAG: NTP transferase domain-containing protein [Spartobacteria bacterium]